MPPTTRATPLLLALFVSAGCSLEPVPERAVRTASQIAFPGLSDARMVDLTHPFDERTLYWPTSPAAFEQDTLAFGDTDGGWFYSAFAYSSPEHGGTHLDAPIHFARGRRAVDEIPLEQLIGPAVVLDVSPQATADPDYRLTVEDVRAFEEAHGAIPRGAIVLLRTGWDARWPDAASYLGADTPGDASNLHFPSYGVEAARFLVEERGAAALGADVASIDYGASTDFVVHRLAMEANVPGLENLANLDELPPTGALVMALPMLIRGGSGAPLRAIAFVPQVE